MIAAETSGTWENKEGSFKESDDVKDSLSQDLRHTRKPAGAALAKHVRVLFEFGGHRRIDSNFGRFDAASFVRLYDLSNPNWLTSE